MIEMCEMKVHEKPGQFENQAAIQQIGCCTAAGITVHCIFVGQEPKQVFWH